MINFKKFFFINILEKNIVVVLNNSYVVCNTIIENRTKVKLKLSGTKERAQLAATLPIKDGYYELNFNKTIHIHSGVLKKNKNDLKYLFKNKIKWIFKKFKYHGKGYKVKKFNSLSKITFRLGKSHWTKVLFNQNKITIKRTKKNTYTCITTNRYSLSRLQIMVKKIKGANIYTKRGLRLNRQTLKKRFGKVSQASSIYK